jgi:hypothetical protein
MLAHIVSPPTGGHSTQRRTQPKGGFSRHVVGMPGVLVAIVRRVRRLVDAHEPRMVRVAACDGMVLQLAEMPGEGDVLRA